MSRPIGSKNKPKPTLSDVKAMSKEERVAWLDRKEKESPTVPSVERRAQRGKQKEIPSTITSQSNEETTSSGEVGVEIAGVRVIKGFVNIQKNTMNPKRISYYTGADIHDTIELAKSAATKNTVATVYMAFEVKV